MRILYLRTDYCTDRSAQFVEINKYEVVESTSYSAALRLLKTTCFDALVIDDRGTPETVQFIADARNVLPDLPVFVVSAWGTDLGMALNSIASVNELATAC